MLQVRAGLAVKGTSSLSEKSPRLVYSVDPVPRVFGLNQRVKFCDKRGTEHYGGVRWIGRRARDRTFVFAVKCKWKFTRFSTYVIGETSVYFGC